MNQTNRLINLHRNRMRMRIAFLNQTKKDKNIIYGARSINAQVGVLSRSTDDYDVFTKNPRNSAIKTEKNFDKISGADNFYTKPAMHPGTFKVMSKGNDMKKGTNCGGTWSYIKLILTAKISSLTT